MTTAPTIVELRDVSKRFVLHKETSVKERVLGTVTRSRRRPDDFWALRDIDLDIAAGTTVGLIGANGSGKSTLLKVIGAIIQPTTGEVRRRGRLAALLELGAGFHQDLTGRENVYLNASILGMSQQETARHFDAIVDFSGIPDFIDTQVKFYSSGMYVRLAFAVAVHVDPDLLLVDEVLAVGDEPFQRKCMDKIRSFQHEGRTIALVSHSADQVGELCDRTVFLHDGRIEVDGTPQEGIKALREAFESDRRDREDAAPATGQGGHGAGTGRFRGVRVLDGEGRPADLLDTGRPMAIEIDLELFQRTPEWLLSLSVETPKGQFVFGTNSQRTQARLPDAPGNHRFTIAIPEVRLGSGQYVVRVRASRLDGELIDLVPQAAMFSVSASSLGSGLVEMEPSLRVS